MICLIEREEKTPPQRKPAYQESQYRKKLIQVTAAYASSFTVPFPLSCKTLHI